MYLRLVKGWKFGDMLYVTRSGLKKSIAQVTEGACPVVSDCMRALRHTATGLPHASSSLLELQHGGVAASPVITQVG